MKNFALRLYDPEAEALERLAIVTGKSKNELINDAIAEYYEKVDALAERNKITGRLDLNYYDGYFFEGMLLKMLNKSPDDDTLEYKPEYFEQLADKDPELIKALYNAALYSRAADFEEYKKASAANCTDREEQFNKLLSALTKAADELEKIYGERKQTKLL